MSKPVRVIILGAAGRDFHNFNQCYRGLPDFQVVAFTATQIPGIENRRYPASLAGPGYPEGIPIVPEQELEQWIRDHQVDEVVFSYSDVTFDHVMQLACRAMACGADYRLLGPRSTQLKARVPVVAVCAVRTGAGKSQTSRRVVEILKDHGVHRIAVIRHPMPYGDLEAQRAQRFASLEDIRRHGCTLEEREEYEPHVRAGTVVYAGVDYAAILEMAQEEAEVLVFDGGNNDFSFLIPDLLITVVDPLRLGHETGYFPGEVNLRAAHLIMINKVDMAPSETLHSLCEHLTRINPGATLVEAESQLTVEGQQIEGKKVMVVDDGPSLTHGDLPFGAGFVAAMRHHPAELIDPRPYAVGSLAEVYRRFPHLGPVLPAMGYSPQQCDELRRTIETSPAELVVIGTPIDLGSAIGLSLPTLRVSYNLVERGPELARALVSTLERRHKS